MGQSTVRIRRQVGIKKKNRRRLKNGITFIMLTISNPECIIHAKNGESHIISGENQI